MSWISIEIESILVLTNNVYSDPILMKELMVFWIGKPTLDPKKASRKSGLHLQLKNQSLSLGPLSRKKMLGYSSISKAPKNRTHMHHISWIIAKSNQPIWPILASKFGQNFQKFSYKNNFCTRWRSKKMLLVFNSFTQQIFSD